MASIRIAWIPLGKDLGTEQPVEILEHQGNGKTTVRGLQLTYLDGQPWLRKGEIAAIETDKLRISEEGIL